MTETDTAEGAGQRTVGCRSVRGGIEIFRYSRKGIEEPGVIRQGKFVVNSASLECVRQHDRGSGCDEC